MSGKCINYTCCLRPDQKWWGKGKTIRLLKWMFSLFLLCIFLPKGFTLGLVNVGAPAGGMNSAGRAAVRLAQYEGHTVLGIRDGFDGLLEDKVCRTGRLT